MSAESNADQGPGASFGSAPAGTGERATPQRGPGPGQAMGGPARFMGGMSTEKALDFKGSSRRLLALLSPHRMLVQPRARTCASAA